MSRQIHFSENPEAIHLGTTVTIDNAAGEIRVYHPDGEVTAIPLGAYRMFRPDHDAMYVGEQTVWTPRPRKSS